MTPGKTATVSGSVDSEAQRFAMDFVQGNDIVFHLNLRFKEKIIVCNNLSCGSWCSEERHCLCAFEKDKAFKVCVCVLLSELLLCTDGTLSCSSKRYSYFDSDI
uniref:Galectin n=1 Tax=Scleropages formosus TaxID=113540 RepID=A0A8C9RCL6_SCLFO